MSLPLDLLSRAVATPDATALETASATWSFATLAAAACRGADFVQSDTPATHGPVALLLPGGAEFVAWFHAVGIVGRTIVPVNARLTAHEIARQLIDARAEVVLGAATDERIAQLARLVPGLRARALPPVDVPEDPDNSSEALLHKDRPRGGVGEPYALVFTSGTAGRAKGACLSRENFEASAAAAADRLGTVVSERWLACMPLFHVGGLSMLTRSVIFGGPVRLVPRFDAALVSEQLDMGDVAGISLVPTMLARLLAHRGRRPAPPGLRMLLLGGAPAAAELLERACSLGYPVCPTYGLTEATSQVATAKLPAPGSTHPAPMLPLRGIDVRIVTDGRNARREEPGEILVRGSTVMSGYVNAPDATAAALRDGWLHTGDVGFLDAEGGLHVLDRRDDLILSGGENVYPAEIEALLLEHPSVADAGVAGVPDVDLGARVVAWIVLNAGAARDSAALTAHCSARLARFKRPAEYRYVDALPRTAAGKLQRALLKGLAAER